MTSSASLEAYCLDAHFNRTVGGYAGLKRVMNWNLEFMDKSDEGKAYQDLAKRVDEAIQFMIACGLDYSTAIMSETEFYVSHECLLMEYEQALTRQDSTTGLWSAPLPYI